MWRRLKTAVAGPDGACIGRHINEVAARREVEGKFSPFVEPRPITFNWLTMEGDVNLLISVDGEW